MFIESLWIPLSLISAFTLATSDALTKGALRIDNEYVLAWLRLVFSLPLLILILFFIPFPKVDITFYRTFLLSLPLEILALVLYIKALRISPLSLTLPFLSLTPVFLIVTSNLILGERVSLTGAAGIFSIGIGGYTLNISSIKKGFFEPIRAIIRERGSLYMIIVSFIYSITSALGKLAIEHSSPLFFGSTYFIAVTLFFTPFVYKNLNSKGMTAVMMKEMKAAILPGFFYSVMIASHMVAISVAKVAYMIAIKRSSLIMGSIYGFVFFEERNVLERLLGALFMLAGFALIVID
jgi:drug/metabolite transporter (DMT)-like permease